MSAKKPSAAFSPAVERAYTLSELQETIRVFEAVKKFTESPWIARAVYAAGIGAIFEIVHLAWLAVRYLWKF
jgi:hypothetical protein